MRIYFFLVILFFASKINAQSSSFDYLKVGHVQLLYVADEEIYEDSIIVISIS